MIDSIHQRISARYDGHTWVLFLFDELVWHTHVWLCHILGLVLHTFQTYWKEKHFIFYLHFLKNTFSCIFEYLKTNTYCVSNISPADFICSYLGHRGIETAQYNTMQYNTIAEFLISPKISTHTTCIIVDNSLSIYINGCIHEIIQNLTPNVRYRNKHNRLEYVKHNTLV